jgi:tRNA-dihydrouridine synthase B
MVCAEMVSANALHYNDERSRQMLATFPDEHPVSLQVFGNDPDRLASAAQAAAESGADVVDLNCGCPVPKITKSGGGISLMRDESLFARCVGAMVKAVRVPVTVKMRLGFRGEGNQAIQFARLAEAEGAAAVAVHARSREDRHQGAPQLDELRRVVEAVRIPVFGNGGVQTYDDARAMMDRGGVAGVLVGQAAIGNPFLFLEFLAREKGRAEPISIRQRFDLFREHLAMIVEYYGETVGVRRLRKYIPAYVKGLPGSASFRGRVNLLNTKTEVLDALSEFQNSLL